MFTVATVNIFVWTMELDHYYPINIFITSFRKNLPFQYIQVFILVDIYSLLLSIEI